MEILAHFYESFDLLRLRDGSMSTYSFTEWNMGDNTAPYGTIYKGRKVCHIAVRKTGTFASVFLAQGEKKRGKLC